MRLHDHFINHGNFLFRWRNYTPFFLLPLFFMAVPESAKMERIVGDSSSHLWTYLCMGISALGLLIRAVAIGYSAPGTSGRNRHGQVADSLNTTGIYSIVRHPLYFGNYMGLLGLMLSTMVWWVVVIGTLIYWLVIERIIETEETFLISKFGDEYIRWSDKTPTFLPNISRWILPSGRFFWPEILKREYNGIAALAGAYLLIDAMVDLAGEGLKPIAWVSEDVVLIIIFFLCLALLIALRALKKFTSLLTEARDR